MKFGFYLFTLFWCFSACTLTAEQERTLSEELNKFIKVNNGNKGLLLAGATFHPIVSHYQALGDSVFLSKFSNTQNTNAVKITNFIFNGEKVENQLIHKRISIDLYNKKEQKNYKQFLYAISEDHGNTWFFANEIDYNNYAIKNFKRLFK